MEKFFTISYKILILLLFLVGNLTYNYSEVRDKNNKLISLRIVMDNNYPPFVIQDNKGNLSGYLIDFWNIWSEKTGIKIELVGMDWFSALDSMKNGHFDIIETIFDMPDRREYLDFTAPYQTNEVPVFYRNSITAINDIKSLSGFNIGVKEGDASIEKLREQGIESFKYYKNYEQIIIDAKANKINLFCIDYNPAIYYIYKYQLEDQFKKTEPLFIGSFHRAVKKGNKELLSIINYGQSKFTEHEMNSLYDKWFGKKIESNNFLFYILIIIVVTIVSLGILSLVNFLLRKKVNKKTLELSHALEDLKRSENKYKMLFEDSVSAIIISDFEGQIIDINLNALNLLEFSREEVNKLKITSLFTEAELEFNPLNYDMLINGNDVKNERRIISKSGNIIIIEMLSKIITDNKIQTIISDITLRKKLEDEIKSQNLLLEAKISSRTQDLENALEDLRNENEKSNLAQAQLDNLNKQLEESLNNEKELNVLKSKFVSIASHEFKTPLTAILSSTYILEKYLEIKDYDSIKTYIGKIQKIVMEMNSLISDLLNYSASEKDTMAIIYEDVDIRTLCAKIIELTGNIGKNNNPVELNIHLKEEIIFSVSRHLEHILINLLSNALKYSVELSPIEINIYEDLSYHYIKIKNEGIGISKEDQKRMFVPFYRANDVTFIPGTGLGLSIVANSVKLLKGTIEINSDINQGAEFTVKLPKEIRNPNYKENQKLTEIFLGR